MANFTNIGVGPEPKKRTPPPPPFGGAKKPAVDVMLAVGMPKKKPMGEAPVQDDEAGEAPDFEAQEEGGAKLVQAITDAGASVGIHDPAQARKAAAAFYLAAAQCLGGDNETDEPLMSDMGDGAHEGMGE